MMQYNQKQHKVQPLKWHEVEAALVEQFQPRLNIITVRFAVWLL